MNEGKETDQLQYKGNSFPRWLISIWVVFFVFGVAYMLKFGIPDLFKWIN